MEYIFQRKIYEQISQWKRENAGRSAATDCIFTRGQKMKDTTTKLTFCFREEQRSVLWK